MVPCGLSQRSCLCCVIRFGATFVKVGHFRVVLFANVAPKVISLLDCFLMYHRRDAGLNLFPVLYWKANKGSNTELSVEKQRYTVQLASVARNLQNTGPSLLAGSGARLEVVVYVSLSLVQLDGQGRVC
ncbi:hypothetical protein J6590_050492 [Homalodisca vitripennis]|nr:hypothetical protein J6590_050492 [Homalodisca vitripennis]